MHQPGVTHAYALHSCLHFIYMTPCDVSHACLAARASSQNVKRVNCHLDHRRLCLIYAPRALYTAAQSHTPHAGRAPLRAPWPLRRCAPCGWWGPELSLARAARGPARGWCDTCVWKCIQQVALFWDRTLPGLLSHLGHGDDYMLHRGPGRHVAGGHWVVAGGLHFSSQPSALPAPSSKSPGTKVGG